MDRTSGNKRRVRRRKVPALIPGAVLFALAVLRSCVCVGAAASTSWPTKVHGKADDVAAGGGKEKLEASKQEEATRPASAGASEKGAGSTRPRMHLGLPGGLHAELLGSQIFVG